MSHLIWIIGNVWIVLATIVYIWLFRRHDSSIVVISQILAQVAIILFMINVNMYFIFLVIRKTPHRKVKIRLANLARQLMKWHIKIAITATIIILGHIIINFSEFGPILRYSHLKMLTGYISTLFLISTLLAGYLRHKKANGFRKKFHRILAIIFVIMFFAHLLIPF